MSRERDLGVIMTPDFNYSEQTREVTNKAVRQSNFIPRSFVLKDVKMIRIVQNLYPANSHILSTGLGSEAEARREAPVDSL